MPVPGLSLVGFMEEQAAIAYLRNRCIPPDPTDAALVAVWNTAKAPYALSIGSETRIWCGFWRGEHLLP